MRQRAQESDATGRVLQHVLAHGLLVPTPIVFSLWMPILEQAADKGIPGIIFDGNPRKLYEAHMLEEVLEMYGWKDAFRAVHIQVSEEEARSRMEARARADDTPASIEERLSWFRSEVQPVLAYYRERGVLAEVNGEQEPDAVFRDLTRELAPVLSP